MIANADELADWIRDNVHEEGYGADNPMKAAFWFVAVQEARAVFDMRLRDVADVILKGEKFAGPIDEDYVNEWLAEGNTGDEDVLLLALKRHFGLL